MRCNHMPAAQNFDRNAMESYLTLTPSHRGHHDGSIIVHNVVTHVRKSNPYGRPVHIFYHFQLSCIALFSCYRSICFLACVGFRHQPHFRRAVRTSDRFSRNGPARTSIEGRCLQTHFLGPCAQVRSVVFAVSCLVDVLGHPAADWR